MTTSPEVGSIPATMAAGACCSKHDCSIVVAKQGSPVRVKRHVLKTLE